MEKLEVKQSEWNLKPLLKGDNDPEIEKKRKELEKKSYEFISKWKNRTDYLKKPEILKEALDEYGEWAKNFGSTGNEGYYFELRTFQDQNNPTLKAKYKKIEEFGKKIENDIQFFLIRIAKIRESEQKKFLNYEGLKIYNHFLEKLFMQSRYLLSEPEEMIMNLKDPTAYSNWVKMVSGLLSKEEKEITLENGKKELKNFSEILSLVDSSNKKTRDSAIAALNEIMSKHVEIAEAEMNSILANKKVDDGLRKMPRPDFARHLSDDIDSKIVDTLVDAVSKRFDIPRKYYELKAKLLGVKKLNYGEKNIPYGKIDKKYHYNEAIDMVYRVFSSLDREFSNIVYKFNKEGNLDVFPRKGKRSGACCCYGLTSHPIYILLNHTDKLNDVLTIAHELGHGISDELTKNKQNALNFGTPLSLAEVSSTFMEDFVLEEILREADDELRLSIMMMKLNDDMATIFRQIACYQFEQEMHKEFKEKGYLSKEEIGAIFKKHMADYLGTYVDVNGFEDWWVYWSHIRTFFYVYSYANGLLISKALQRQVKKDNKSIEKVKEFMSAGTSDSPKNIFFKLGIDISKREFWDEGLAETEKLLNETERLAKSLGKI